MLQKLVQKTAEGTGDLTENKMADKINSVRKTKSKEKEYETNTWQEIYIPPEKRQQIIDVLRLFEHHIKNGITKITNLLDITSDNASRFINKKWIEVHDQSGNTEDTHKTSKELR